MVTSGEQGSYSTPSSSSLSEGQLFPKLVPDIILLKYVLCHKTGKESQAKRDKNSALK